jgi:hypothetical protein
MMDIDTRTPDDRADEHKLIGFCVCDTPTACVACTPDPDPEALEFERLVRQGMEPGEAAAVMDAEWLSEAEWLALYG